MRYYIAADGGGTKLLAILYDENLRVVNSARMSGSNALQSPEQLAEDMRRLIEELIPGEITEIEGADLSIVGNKEKLRELLQRRCTVKSCHFHGEGDTALAAAGERYGIVAQAGTGSDAFLVQPGSRSVVGGWGYLLGDEGSGYDIGSRTLKAAIYAQDGRGPGTEISELLMERWKLPRLLDIIDRVRQSRDHKSLIASASYITAEAAGRNDPVALAIYENAAHELAVQVTAIIENNGGVWEGPVVASGGAWKGHPRMFEAFSGEILARYPEATVKFPVYEPVVGCAVLRRLAEGESFGDFEDLLQSRFQAFLYCRT